MLSPSCRSAANVCGFFNGALFARRAKFGTFCRMFLAEKLELKCLRRSILRASALLLRHYNKMGRQKVRSKTVRQRASHISQAGCITLISYWCRINYSFQHCNLLAVVFIYNSKRCRWPKALYLLLSFFLKQLSAQIFIIPYYLLQKSIYYV